MISSRHFSVLFFLGFRGKVAGNSAIRGMGAFLLCSEHHSRCSSRLIKVTSSLMDSCNLDVLHCSNSGIAIEL